jgi:ABC-2 type transport system ATP-binding protein
MDAVTTTGLTKRYGHRESPLRRHVDSRASDIVALDDLSIAVHDGEIFGFLGPNGAGKSTTIRLLLGFLHPSSGTGTVLGRDIVRDSVDIRRRVGYLPGGIALYDTMTGERLLDYLAP